MESDSLGDNFNMKLRIRFYSNWRFYKRSFCSYGSIIDWFDLKTFWYNSDRTIEFSLTVINFRALLTWKIK